MPGMPKSDSATMERFTALLPKDNRIQIRPMFGHRAAFVNGHMFAGTFGTDVVVRLDEPSRAELLAVPGARIFAPMKDRPMKEYVMLPAAWLATGVKARPWIARALEWTAGKPAKAAKAPAKKTGPRARAR
jgi:TfoX/Sxy family transcriptional regulator of competence genes